MKPSDNTPNPSSQQLNGQSQVVRHVRNTSPRDRTGGIVRLEMLKSITENDRWALGHIEAARPESERKFDQIPMVGMDLLCQTKFMSERLHDQAVVFIGDADGTGTLLALLRVMNGDPGPNNILILDFDERLLNAFERIAQTFGLENMIRFDKYNVFDSVPTSYAAQFDWFYTNPPYGSRNNGESARLFITRGIEFSRNPGGAGCIILPDDPKRPWTSESMLATQAFLTDVGWSVDEKLSEMHSYDLDDDPELKSSTILVRHATDMPLDLSQLKYARRLVDWDEIPHFYGRNNQPPFPRYLSHDGTGDFDWPQSISEPPSGQ